MNDFANFIFIFSPRRIINLGVDIFYQLCFVQCKSLTFNEKKKFLEWLYRMLKLQ